MSAEAIRHHGRQAAVLAALGALLVVVLLAAAFLGWPEAILRPWLVAWVFTLGFPAGAMVLIITHALLGGVWLRSSMPVLQPMAVTLPLAALLGVPLLFGLGHVYEWAGTMEAAKHLDVAKIYLNPFSYVVRYVVILALWSLMGVWAGLRGATLSPLGGAVMLLVYGITVTLGSTDWIMSIDATWASTAFPAFFAVLQIGSALSVAAMATPLGVNREATEDIGKLFIAIALGLTYLEFIQYLVMWSGNLPDNVKWYIPRANGLWHVVSLVSFFVGTFGPFVLMLPQASRRSPSRVAAAGVLMLAGIAIQYVWLGATQFGISAAWLLPLSFLAVTGLWAGLAAPAARRIEARERRHG